MNLLLVNANNVTETVSPIEEMLSKYFGFFLVDTIDIPITSVYTFEKTFKYAFDTSDFKKAYTENKHIIEYVKPILETAITVKKEKEEELIKSLEMIKYIAMRHKDKSY